MRFRITHFTLVTINMLWITGDDILKNILGWFIPKRSIIIVAKFTTAFIVYGLSTLFMFISSLLFHLVDFKKSQNPNYYSFQFFKIFHVLERGAIYVCIAGNYHPWLQNINTEGAIYTSWFTWISAIFGLWFSYTFYERYKVGQFQF